MATAREVETTAPAAAFAEGLGKKSVTEEERGEVMAETSDKTVMGKRAEERLPEAKLACGSIRGSVWLNQSEQGGEYFTLSLARVYKAPDGSLKATQSFRQKDLPDLLELVQGAQKIIQEDSLKRGLEQPKEVQRVKISR
jgi:hypothetical protein